MFRTWMRTRSAVSRRERPSHAANRSRPHLEALESRWAPSCSPGYVAGGEYVVNCDGGGNEIRLQVDGSHEFRSQGIYYRSGSSWLLAGSFPLWMPAPSSIRLNTGNGDDVVHVNGLARRLTVNGNSGQDTVNVRDVWQTISVSNTYGYTDLDVDARSHWATTASMNASQLTLTFPTTLAGGVPTAWATGYVNYVQNDLSSLTVRLGPYGNTVNVYDTPSSGYSLGCPGLRCITMSNYLQTGSGVDTVRVYRTANRGDLFVEGEGGLDNVTIGDSGGLQNIRGQVQVSNAPSYTALTVDDAGYAGARTAALNVTGEIVSITSLPVPMGRLHWEGASAPADIRFVARDLRALTIRGGRGADVFTVADTPQSSYSGGLLTQLNTGDGDDAVNVEGSTGYLTVQTGNGDDVVALGSTESRLDGIRTGLSVQGGAGRDEVIFRESGRSEGRDYILSGIDFDSSGGPRVTFDSAVEALTLLAGEGDDTVAVISMPAGRQVYVSGGPGTNSLAGLSGYPNVWQISEFNQGFIGDAQVVFNEIANLTGGPGEDYFYLYEGVGLSGRIDGGGGSDTLDCSFFTSDVTVNLTTGSAPGVEGGITGFVHVVGGAGNDILVGDAADNRLSGQAGRDLLIGGAGADTLDGGADEDLLIAGSTAYDADPAALEAVRAEWIEPTDYGTRVYNLQYGTGLSPVLDATTVFADGGNLLTGGEGLDLFFGSLGEPTDWDELAEVFVQQ